MDKAHEKVVEAQFGPRAQAYVESAVHAGGAGRGEIDGCLEEAISRGEAELHRTDRGR